MMKKNEILELAEWFSRSNLTDFHWSEDKFSVSFGKEGERGNPFSNPIRGEITPKVEKKQEVKPVFEDDVKEESEGTFVKSPIVGTFYASPSPTEPPFVTVGQKVKKGQTLCIVEAMKLLNEIVAPEDGVIKKIFVENEAFVGYDDKLMEIEV